MFIHRQTLLRFCQTILVGASLGAVLLTSPATLAQANTTLTMWKDGDPGERLKLSGLIASNSGKPISGARISLRQADGDTQYAPRYQGVVFSGPDGRFEVRTAVPGQYSSAKHIHVHIYAEGFAAINTEILFKGDPNISFGNPGAYEVLLEQVHQGEKTISVGGVEILMTPLGG